MSQRQKKITSYMSNRRVSRFLKVLTWNLAGDDLHASFIFDLETKYEKIALEVKKHKPDILNLQETTVPHEIWEDLGYKLCGSTRSHGSGLVELWYRSESCQLDTHWSVKPDLGSTKYAFPIAQFSGKFGKVTVCNIHLYSGKYKPELRLEKLKKIMEAIGRRNHVIIMGDANMRKAETDDACRVLGMQDAYIQVKKFVDARFTWNSYENKFHANGFELKCRFDRIFLKDFVCHTLDFVGNKSINGAYLSDHFGLVTELEFTDFPNKTLFTIQHEKRKIIILDIETIGFPKKNVYDDYNHPSYLDAYDTSRLVQVSWMICDSCLNEIALKNRIIRPEGFRVQKTEIHGISHEFATKNGREICSVISEFMEDITGAECIVAHKASFDVNVWRSEFIRNKRFDVVEKFNNLEVFDSMVETKFIVNAKDRSNKIKPPRLEELYEFATGKKIQKAHDAMHDVKNLHEALQKLMKSKKIQFISKNQQIKTDKTGKSMLDVDTLSDCLAKIDINHDKTEEYTMKPKKTVSCCLVKMDVNLVKTIEIIVKPKKEVNCSDNNLVRTKEYTVKLKKR